MSSYYLGSGKFGGDWIIIPIIAILAWVAIPQYQRLKTMVDIHRKMEESALVIEQALLTNTPISEHQQELNGTVQFTVSAPGRIKVILNADMGDLADQTLLMTAMVRQQSVVWQCSSNIRTDVFEKISCLEASP